MEEIRECREGVSWRAVRLPGKVETSFIGRLEEVEEEKRK